ncbi:putative UvrD/REP helicase [gamma proteobacterium NOR5-3]|nr:putative UvrD/REP helicase [gamma proteobacterium NOR5-3]
MSNSTSSNIHFISAGAGSGKTYSLTQKLEQLLSSQEVSPAGVIATTFTKLAAGELKERVRSKLIESGQLGVANQMEQALIGTVNGVCGDLLRRFAFEAHMPPDQLVLDEAQGDLLFYQAIEHALATNKPLIRKMNATCHRLQIIDRSRQLNWRAEVKSIADAARANNQSAQDIRYLGKASADGLLAHFPTVTDRDLDRQLLNAIEQALDGIDTDTDGTKVTGKYVSLITGVRAALYNDRATWPEWLSLSKEMPGAKSKPYAEPIADIAIDYAKHPKLHEDIRFFAVSAFEIAADSLSAYQLLKTQKGLIDFVDQEQRLYQLLDHPTVRETLKEELQLLMVDEFQDTSPIQLALFLKLSQLAEQVIWVGDIKQSIYGFRGSDPTLMAAVVKRVTDEGNAPEILENSWRSTPELVAYTNNLFAPAFTDSLRPEQVTLKPARKSFTDNPAVTLWRLQESNKEKRARALAVGVTSLLESKPTVIDKDSQLPRTANYSDVAILCRTHTNLDAVATALSEAKLPIRYKRPGLLATPEGCLALACLRRLIDPLDTLASAEILSLSECESPDNWIAQRIAYLEDTDQKPHQWLEDDETGPIAALKAQRIRLPFLTPVETLRLAIDAGNVRQSVFRWGPTEQRSQHRLNNLAALLGHAEEYMNQCSSQNQPATAAGLVLWLYQLAQAEQDTQATGGSENAIQLVTHHGAKGLEWPFVIAMDLDAKLKPRLWGLTVLPSPHAIDLDNPLANRTLRYWPTFAGLQSAKISLLDDIAASDEGELAMAQELQEAKRLLYVSLTRPRDGLILTMNKNDEDGEWMNTLGADWMLPTTETLELPDGSTIPSAVIELVESEAEITLTPYRPTWLSTTASLVGKLPLRLSPSSIPPNPSATIGEVIEFGERLEITGEYDPATLGSALHAVIATTILGQNSTERVLQDHGVDSVISIEAADKCTNRLMNTIEERFKPFAYYTEYPIHYTTDEGQIVNGWIDLLLETEDGFVLIDHKASPRAKSDWAEIALGYSGQLAAYARGVSQITNKPVVGQWIHFAATGGLVAVSQPSISI